MGEADATRRVYARLARVYDVAFGRILRPGRARAIRQIPSDREVHVLEVGIGTALTVADYRSNCRVVGVDFSAAMLAHGQRRIADLGASDRTALLQADAAHLPFADHSFDVVFAPYVMSVVSDPCRVAREAGRVCRPAGRVMWLNHFGSDRPVWAALERQVSPLTRHVGFRADLQLASLFAGSGLRPVSVQRVNVPPLWKLVTCVKDDSDHSAA